SGLKPELTKLGRARINRAANFLKHADRDPDDELVALSADENDWRIGFCIILYRDLVGAFTPTMAAFHAWMLLRHPDSFQLDEDEDPGFERVYRESLTTQREGGREV